MFTLAGAFADEVTFLMMTDSFDDYVTGTYPGTDGPNIWYQEIGGGGTATYEIVSSGGKTFYRLESSDGVFVKSILYYYLPLLGTVLYMGPNDYTFYATMRVEDGEGGIIFRVQPVKVGAHYYFQKYYLATVYKDSKKVYLWYVDESEGAGAGPVLAVANLPSSVDPSDWFTLSVKVVGNNIKVSVGGKQVIEVNDDRLGFGSVGLYTFKGGAASFDAVTWSANVEQATTTMTTTSTVTETMTTTSTVTTGTTVTTTASAGTVTVTETTATTILETTTLMEATTVTETVTAASAGTVTVTETTTLPATATQTVTTTAWKVRRITKTVTTTVAATQAVGGLKCLIATAAFGSEIAPQVQALREFRDGFILQTFAGSEFMRVFNAFYYSWSPAVAEAERHNPALRDAVKMSIYPLLYSLDLSRKVAILFSSNPELAALIAGLTASALIGLIYVAPPLTVALLVLRRWKPVNVKPIYVALPLLASLALFALAEAVASPPLMAIASSATVLSTMSLGALTPITIISAVKKR